VHHLRSVWHEELPLEPGLVDLVLIVSIFYRYSSMDTFVINLDSRPDRWKNMQKRFKGPQFKLRRFTPIEASNPQYSLLLTTIEILKAAKKEGLANILILEDDCLPVNLEIWPKIKAWLNTHKDKWDIYSGGAQNIYFPNLVGETGQIKFYDPVWSTAAHFLYVAQKSYNKVISHYSNFKYVTNLVPFVSTDIHNNFLKTIVSYPFVAYQDSGYSDVSKTRRNRKKDFRQAEKGLSDIDDK